MTRTDAGVHLHISYSALESRLASSLGLDGYASVINAALRDLGFTESELPDAVVEDDGVAGYLALLDYYALLKYLQAAATLTDTVIDGVPINRSQMIQNIRYLLDNARAVAVGGGWLPDTSAVPVTDMEMGGINLDYLEPAEW